MGQEVVVARQAGLIPATSASEICSVALWRLLSDGADKNDVVRDIARAPKLREECREVLPQLQARAKPVEVDALMTELVAMAAVFGFANRSEQEWATLFGAYIDTLGELPLDAIKAAIAEWHRAGDPFYPKPSDLYKLAKPHYDKLRMVTYRARRAVEFVDNHPRPKTDAERLAERQKMIDLGYLNADGTPNLAPPKAMPTNPPPRPKHEVAAELRRAAGMSTFAPSNEAAKMNVAAPPPAEDDEIEEAL